MGKPRAQVSLPMLRGLNQHVSVKVLEEPLSKALIERKTFQAREHPHNTQHASHHLAQSRRHGARGPHDPNR